MWYHALNRGNGREAVFHKDEDYAAFVSHRRTYCVHCVHCRRCGHCGHCAQSEVTLYANPFGKMDYGEMSAA